MKAILALLALLAASAVNLAATHADTPRLVGYGCNGATGPLFANQEDDFPVCDRIEANR
jgi:hypothetical protein